MYPGATWSILFGFFLRGIFLEGTGRGHHVYGPKVLVLRTLIREGAERLS